MSKANNIIIAIVSFLLSASYTWNSVRYQKPINDERYLRESAIECLILYEVVCLINLKIVMTLNAVELTNLTCTTKSAKDSIKCSLYSLLSMLLKSRSQFH